MSKASKDHKKLIRSNKLEIVGLYCWAGVMVIGAITGLTVCLISLFSKE
mgnify:CR=1 FL=1